MNEKEKRIAEKLAEQVPALNKERMAKLAQIMEVAAMVLETHDEVVAERTEKEAGA